MASTSQNTPGYRKDTVRIPSRTPGWSLDVWRFLPAVVSENEKTARPVPVIVMAHGLGANKLMGIEPYAKEFAKAGWACMVFDYRRWGASDGFPRNILFVTDQLEDYRTVIQYCKKQPMFDPHRVVVWGTSFAGGHATSLAAEPRLGLAGAISQCPYLGGPPVQYSFNLITTIALGLWDYVKQIFGLAPTYIPTCAEPGEVGVMTIRGWTKDMFFLPDDERDYPNTISASSMFEVPLYSPRSHAARIHCPLLLIPTSIDKLSTPTIAHEIQKEAKKGLVRVKAVPGDHFVVYPKQPQYQVSLAAQLEFLREILDGVDEKK